MNSVEFPEHFNKNYADMVAAARACVEGRQHLPALVLIYALADSLAWAASTKAKNSVRSNFENLAETWLIPKLVSEVPTIAAVDLYGARCAVLHTLASDSDLSKAGHAKRVVYAWGNAEAEILGEFIEQTEFAGTLVSIHIETLLRAVEGALSDLFQSAQQDMDLKERLQEAASRQYMSVRHKRP